MIQWFYRFYILRSTLAHARETRERNLKLFDHYVDVINKNREIVNLIYCQVTLLMYNVACIIVVMIVSNLNTDKKIVMICYKQIKIDM